LQSVNAIDIGGTKLTAAVVAADGAILRRNKIAVERGDLPATVRQIAAAIETLHAGDAAIGIIIPGIYSPRTGMAWAPNLWGHDQVPLRAELERTLRARIVIDNDRAGSVMGERWLGIARDIDDVVFLAVGTGIGAGIISGGRLLRGADDIAGAVGWFALPGEWKDLYRDLGCWEAEAAGPALARLASAGSAEEAIAAARAGDAAAMRVVEHVARYLGMGIANLVSMLNPRMVVLGGGLMQAADLFLDTIGRTMAEWAQPVAARQVRIEVTRLGEDAGLFGAARLAFDAIAAEGEV